MIMTYRPLRVILVIAIAAMVLFGAVDCWPAS